MTAIASVISLGILAYFVLFLYNEHRVEHLRQDLFAIRDRLFDEAAAGRISFNSETYRATRDFLNGNIRFAHRLSVSRFFAFRLMFDGHDRSNRQSKFSMHFEAGPPADRALCARYMQETHLRLAAHLGRSPFLVLAWIVAMAFGMLNHGYNVAAMFVQHWRKQFAALDDLAYREGQRSPTANGALAVASRL
jgi:hypothetical protein